MACRGVHFALAAEDLDRVLACETDDDLIDIIQGDIEERYFEAGEWCYETDKAWDAIHRCLAGGYLAPGEGPFPASLAILGGKQLHEEQEYIVSLATSSQVEATAAFLAGVTEEHLRARYFALDEDDYGISLSEEDFAYTWEYFSGLVEFFSRAASRGLAVVFTVDQ